MRLSLFLLEVVFPQNPFDCSQRMAAASSREDSRKESGQARLTGATGSDSRSSSAVVAAYPVGESTTVVVRGEPFVWATSEGQSLRGETLEAFNKTEVTQNWRVNNTALKWIRDQHEEPRGHPTVDEVDLSSVDVMMIGVLYREKGMDYAFVEGERQPWSWRQMIASFSATDKALLLGENGQEVTRMVCAPLPHSYDHKRHHAARVVGKPYLKGAPVPVWDFVVYRSDGKCVRFHPNQTQKKIQITAVAGSYPTAPPRPGPGLSEGPGTYRRFLSETYLPPGLQEETGEASSAVAVAEQREPQASASTVVDSTATTASSNAPQVGPASQSPAKGSGREQRPAHQSQREAASSTAAEAAAWFDQRRLRTSQRREQSWWDDPGQWWSTSSGSRHSWA